MKQMGLSEMLTYSTVRIACKYSNGSLSLGTGFIMNLCENKETGTFYPAILTNYHVVKDCVETEFEFCKADTNGNPIDTEPFSITISNGNAWTHHPNQSIDLCFLPLKTILEEVTKVGGRIFYLPISTDLIADEKCLSELRAMEEVTMIGYPQGLMDEYNHKPIIRRGITSTHPRNNYMGKPEILLDIAAYPGSSGSPVFLLNEGTYVVGNTVRIGTRVKLLGILYAGPQFTAVGEIKFFNLPSKPTPIMNIPNNLGVAIKATEIKTIESFIEMINHKAEAD